MPFLPRKHFGWKEPLAFLQRQDALERAKRRWWHGPVAMLFLTFLMLLDGQIGKLKPRHLEKPSVSFGDALAFGITVGLLVVYVQPWMLRRIPPQVVFRERSFFRQRGNNPHLIKYANLAYFAWGTDQDTLTLTLTPRRGRREIVLGLAPEISRDDLTMFLLERGVSPKPTARDAPLIQLENGGAMPETPPSGLTPSRQT